MRAVGCADDEPSRGPTDTPKAEALRDLADPTSTLSTVLDALPDGVYIVDQDRRILFWNRAAETITGYSAAEVRGRRCLDDILNHVDDDGQRLCFVACPLAHTLSTGATHEAKVFPLLKSGGRIPVWTRIGALRDREGRIVAAIEIFRDISQDEDFRILQEKFNALIRTYVSSATLDEVMHRIEGDGNGSAQTRDMTVLYADVVGFAAFAEGHTPSESARLLNEVFGLCAVIFREHHGDIDKFIGDAVMAVFLDANDAVRAGMRLLAALPEFNAARAARGRDAVRLRVGVNSGAVLQGEIGAFDRKDVTVIGDTVNAAARIQAAAEPDSLCISAATHARLKDPGGFRPHKTVTVKNRVQPVALFIHEASAPPNDT